MKKKCLLFIYIFIIIVLTVGCLNQKRNSNEISLTDIINNKITFITEDGKSVYLNDYKSIEYENLEIIPEKYVLIDLNGDNIEELVLYLTEDYGTYLVFYRYKSNIYSFEFTERALINLKTDGTFIQSEGAGINSYVKLIFDYNKYKIIEEAYKNDMDSTYLINGTVSTIENVDDYINEFNKKEDVNWITVSQ